MSERYHTIDTAKGSWDLRPCVPVFEALPVAEKSLLDVGCRDGWHSMLFSKMGAQVSCIDVYDSPYRSQDLNFRQVDVFRFRPGRKWDVVFCGDVIQHVEHQIGFLRALRRFTKQTLYLTTDIHPELGNSSIIHSQSTYKYGVQTYPFLFGEEFLLGLLSLAGFRNGRRLAHWQVKADKAEYAEILPEGRSVMLFTADA